MNEFLVEGPAAAKRHNPRAGAPQRLPAHRLRSDCSSLFAACQTTVWQHCRVGWEYHAEIIDRWKI